MKLRPFKLPPARTGSVLILVLWIALGLLAIALYFANSMTYEYAASDNRASGLAADQAIEGGARYAAYVLANYATNGAVPATSEYQAADVPVGDAHFWIIGRNPDGTPSSEPYFGLMDEGSKFNLNTTTANTLSYLPNMTVDFADAIVDWRSTNGAGAYGLNYSSLGYEDKNSPFETVDELRLVYGATMDLLEGDDLNDNGALDANETPLNGGNVSTPGLFDYVTVYSREPNFHSDGSSPTNVNTASRAQLQALLSGAGVGNAGGLGERLFRDRTSSGPAAGMLAFCIRCREAGMS
ncbi:MAG: general secretion pathway protein GspK, partial [Verrucomicrobia bacterium]|nr:general secretion pathway protein GspK [Verrucomicrobiota bacterium]